jgi:hypothetical protein
LSAHSGLPALSVPAGFTTDGVPLGVEFLGAALSEEQLLSLGYAVEQTLKTRQAPFSTPPLIAGTSPAPRSATAKTGGATLSLLYDGTTSTLQSTMTFDAKQPVHLASAWLHAGTVDKPAAARHRLFSSSADRQGKSVTLSFADRRALTEGQMFVRFYFDGPASPVAVPLPELRSWK